MNEHGIDETLETLEALQLVLVGLAKVFKDGKIDLKDLLVAVDLLKQINVVIDGIKGIKNIPAEIKDLQKDEIIAIGSKVYEIVGAIKKV